MSVVVKRGDGLAVGAAPRPAASTRRRDGMNERDATAMIDVSATLWRPQPKIP
jgi:hypothetical protein